MQACQQHQENLVSGGNGSICSNGPGSGGGGGGLYGGAGGSGIKNGSPGIGTGGGGSGYVNSSILSSAQTIAGNCSFPSITIGSNETGHSGNGHAKITQLD